MFKMLTRGIDWLEKLNYTFKILCPLLEFDYFCRYSKSKIVLFLNAPRTFTVHREAFCTRQTCEMRVVSK